MTARLDVSPPELTLPPPIGLYQISLSGLQGREFSIRGSHTARRKAVGQSPLYSICSPLTCPPACELERVRLLTGPWDKFHRRQSLGAGCVAGEGQSRESKSALTVKLQSPIPQGLTCTFCVSYVLSPSNWTHPCPHLTRKDTASQTGRTPPLDHRTSKWRYWSSRPSQCNFRSGALPNVPSGSLVQRPAGFF
ncbi:uncharacterized protein LOC119516834 isoform X1 [Choloepus didactylus]|uniref:uncharacterized protein LOC119516834 isoform X1 n=1 Tax=Choloepus didactylus TaxID=27675 RepID=UPI00189D4903|nr:uncharacterized protein LOC119516834 isoform X1 [Choloepus didactylus]